MSRPGRPGGGRSSLTTGADVLEWSEAKLESLARRIDGAFPALSREERRIALAVFRRMASGRPADVSSIAARAGTGEGAVEDALERWPSVVRDEAGGVVGFWGLALADAPHPFRVSGATLYGWCAWDTLFLGELMGEDLRIESTCAATGRPVTLLAGAEGVRLLDPTQAVVSFIDPDCCDVECDRVIPSFCHHVRFFESPDAWRAWAPGHSPPTFLLTVEAAWRLGKISNRLRYGTQLEQAGRSASMETGR